MVKRLTNWQKSEREVNRMVQKIRKFEKSHSVNIVERACSRYRNLNYQKRSAEHHIKILQEDLEDAKKKLKI